MTILDIGSFVPSGEAVTEDNFADAKRAATLAAGEIVLKTLADALIVDHGRVLLVAKYALDDPCCRVHEVPQDATM